ncbi:head GIN domain-containing protein [Marinigracilibium pacificum]|uniref:DUF2807 domain-containing protein n=1 Tax=Marinigracilibium pacificum TaxID=2729599 RepID=A0A848J2M0_9BACT|nr:head GIN domain-containing protein [Marinigracilibium pacificum]NMM48569.1 DUF2807 domain-containing protein [Marinigracilibium pacificum]
MKNFVPLFWLCLISFIWACDDTSCIDGEGPIVTENLELDDISSFNLEGSFDVVVSQGTNQNIVAEGYPNIISALNTRVSNGHWDINFRERCVRSLRLTIFITVPDLKAIKLTGSGSISVNDFDLEGESFNVDLIGSGDILLNELNGLSSVSSFIEGSGNINFLKLVDGIDTESVYILGSGNCKGFNIEGDHVNAKLEGSGNIEVTANIILDAIIEGSGNIYYKGSPQINSSIIGSGEIINSN